MNEQQMYLFMDVVAYGSLSQAANKENISVPALKKRIDAIERELGVKLLIRTNKGSEVTMAGKSFYRYCIEATHNYERELEKLRLLSNADAQRTVFIGYDNDHVRDYRFRDAVVSFMDDYPNIHIICEKCRFFDREKYDLFFGANYSEDADIRSHYLVDLPLSCIMRKDDALAAYDSLSLDQLDIARTVFPPKAMLQYVQPQHTAIKGCSYMNMEEQYDTLFMKCLLEKRIYVIIGRDDHMHSRLIQIPLTGVRMKYRLYSYRISEKPVVELIVRYLQEQYAMDGKL